MSEWLYGGDAHSSWLSLTHVASVSPIHPKRQRSRCSRPGSARSVKSEKSLPLITTCVSPVTGPPVRCRCEIRASRGSYTVYSAAECESAAASCQSPLSVTRTSSVARL